MTDASAAPVRIAACECLTAFGDTAATLRRLLAGEVALQPVPVHGAPGDDLVPLALFPGRALAESAPPAWLSALDPLLAPAAGPAWGTARRPVFVTSSNFGVGSMHAFRQTADAAHLAFGPPARSIAAIAARFGWGENIHALSHACVSAHLGLWQASHHLAAGLADEALVFSYDFLSPFVAGGFHALKILNAAFPAPYQDRPTGAIGLGDGAAFAILTRDRGDFTLAAQSLHNEMHHFTANRPDGAGFAATLAGLDTAGRRVWLKGHGTGTLEAGRLEATAFADRWPGSPLVSWKGSLGHTLGSCGLVELALALAALRLGRAPGTPGATPAAFTDAVAFDSFDLSAFDSVVCASNAFGGAHAALLVDHA